MRDAGLRDYFRVFSCTLRRAMPLCNGQFGQRPLAGGQSREGFPRSYH